MRLVASIVLYTALACGANAADLSALLKGDMARFIVADAPVALPAATLVDESDAEHPVEELKGKVVLLNFWATWCAPCRKEMPSLDRLQAALGGDGFRVVTVAAGRNTVPGIRRFFDEVGVTRLPMLRDPRMDLAGPMGVVAMPVSVLLDRDGAEIGRFIGDTAWDGPDARALIEAVIAEPPAVP
jgi:thiol-disulfide isomerase/thioredoxin